LTGKWPIRSSGSNKPGLDFKEEIYILKIKLLDKQQGVTQNRVDLFLLSLAGNMLNTVSWVSGGHVLNSHHSATLANLYRVPHEQAATFRGSVWLCNASGCNIISVLGLPRWRTWLVSSKYHWN
jgi:hypothetical protein